MASPKRARLAVNNRTPLELKVKGNEGDIQFTNNECWLVRRVKYEERFQSAGWVVGWRTSENWFVEDPIPRIVS